MIAVVRISGKIKLKQPITETLNRMRIMKKYGCVVLNENPETMGMIKKVKDFVAYGKISSETLTALIKARGRMIGKKNAPVENADRVASEFSAGKKFEDLNIKPFFRLHPPIGGIDTKMHYPKGVLGNNGDDINKLIMRML